MIGLAGIRPLAVRHASVPDSGSAIESEAEPLGLFLCEAVKRIVVKAAILIDGGYFLRRLHSVRPDVDTSNADMVARSVEQLVRGHLRKLGEVHAVANPLALLYRTFYYDAQPYDRKGHSPVGRRPIDWSRTDQAKFRRQLFDALRASPNVVVRLGEVRRDADRGWILHDRAQQDLLAGRRTALDLNDNDFAPALRQKGVDMRIGLDIASISLKRQASIIVLVSGDADFVPAAKLARREGVQFILDPLWQRIPSDLSEHIDGLRSGFFAPRHRGGEAAEE